MARLVDLVWGVGIGEALGLPFQDMPQGTFECTDFEGYRAYNKPEGTWGDYTSITLALCDTIKRYQKGLGVPKESQFRASLSDYISGGLYAFRADRFCTNKDLINSVRNEIGNSDINSNSAFCCLGGMVLGTMDTKVSRLNVEAICGTTHQHPIALDSALLSANITKNLTRGMVMEDILLSIEPKMTDTVYSDCALWLNQTVLPKVTSDNVVEVLKTALWSVMTSNSYREAVCKAVNHGVATRELGAITGGFAGLAFGLDVDLKERVLGKDLLNKFIYEF